MHPRLVPGRGEYGACSGDGKGKHRGGFIVFVNLWYGMRFAFKGRRPRQLGIEKDPNESRVINTGCMF